MRHTVWRRNLNVPGDWREVKTEKDRADALSTEEAFLKGLMHGETVVLPKGVLPWGEWVPLKGDRT